MSKKPETTKIRKTFSIVQILTVSFILMKVIPFGEVGNWSWWVVLSPTFGYLIIKCVSKIINRVLDNGIIYLRNGDVIEVSKEDYVTLVKAMERGEETVTFKGANTLPYLCIKIADITHASNP
jgi:hypothetical protein